MDLAARSPRHSLDGHDIIRPSTLANECAVQEGQGWVWTVEVDASLAVQKLKQIGFQPQSDHTLIENWFIGRIDHH